MKTSILLIILMNILVILHCIKKSGQKKNLDKITIFITEIAIHPKTGTGHPEPLKGYEHRNVYSRRIDKKHRLIYEIFEEEKRVELLSAWGYYDDK